MFLTPIISEGLAGDLARALRRAQPTELKDEKVREALIDLLCKDGRNQILDGTPRSAVARCIRAARHQKD